jgi:hypothetical protein
MHAKAVVAHGGGPTAVINASLAGLIDACRRRGSVLSGARYGLAGLLRGDLVDLLALNVDLVRQIGESPGSVLRSSRLPLTEEDCARLLDVFRRAEVDTFFYTGGNGSMDTAVRIARYARSARYDLHVIGIPKTIDNDLCITDHTPGYASTARFFACAARDVGEDNRSLPSPVCVLETLGRNAGWIVAATSLARHGEDDAPHLIYFPERRLSLARIAADVERGGGSRSAKRGQSGWRRQRRNANEAKSRPRPRQRSEPRRVRYRLSRACPAGGATCRRAWLRRCGASDRRAGGRLSLLVDRSWPGGRRHAEGIALAGELSGVAEWSGGTLRRANRLGPKIRRRRSPGPALFISC